MAIFVIGMHRSGTSMVAGALQKLGVHFGEESELLPANSANEFGYFEHQSALALNDALARANHATWRTLPSVEVSTGMAGLDDYRAGVRTLVSEMELQAPWGLKDPRLSFFLPLWRPHVREAHVVVCIRRPEAVARSLLQRNKVPLAYGAALWELYTLAALANSARFPRTVVFYEDFVAEPEHAIAHFAAKLEEWEGIKPDATQLREAALHVRPELDHGGDSSTESHAGEYTSQMSLYERLRSDGLDGVNAHDASASREIIRLEQSHQNAKSTIDNLRNELSQRTAALSKEQARIEAVQERLCDLLGWARLTQPDAAASPAKQEPESVESQLESLRKIIHVAGQVAALRPLAEQARAELIASKDERIAWREAELQRLASRLSESEERHQAILVEVLDLRARVEAAQRKNALLDETFQRDVAEYAERAAASAAETRRTRALLEGAAKENAALKAELDAAKHRAQETQRNAEKATSEVEALRRALQSARSAPPPPSPNEKKAAATAAAKSAQPDNSGALRASYRGRFKAMQQIITSIDQLLSPPLGRFAVPVRSIRGELVRLRAIVTSELEAGRKKNISEE